MWSLNNSADVHPEIPSVRSSCAEVAHQALCRNHAKAVMLVSMLRSGQTWLGWMESSQWEHLCVINRYQPLLGDEFETLIRIYKSLWIKKYSQEVQKGRIYSLQIFQRLKFSHRFFGLKDWDHGTFDLFKRPIEKLQRPRCRPAPACRFLGVNVCRATANANENYRSSHLLFAIKILEKTWKSHGFCMFLDPYGRVETPRFMEWFLPSQCFPQKLDDQEKLQLVM